jgi:lysophospholipase
MTSVKTNQQSSLKNNLVDAITEFWLQGIFNSFKGVENADIHYAVFVHQHGNAPALVIVPGRSESYLKYQELALDLYTQGYNIFIIDHRGQGLSERLLENPHKGYVKDFQDYVEDFRYLIENIVTQYCLTKPFILAHSMGGAIATRFMQDSPNAIQAAVISSPMLGFNSGLLPQSMAKALITIRLAINSLFGKTPWYFLGQNNYRPTPFSKNKLSHCSQRYQRFIELYQSNRKIQLGGVTSHWLAQGIQTQKSIFTKIGQLKTPILLIQAGSDDIVCQKAQDIFCQKLHALQPKSCPNGTPIRINGAYHELFFEIDEYRDIALKKSLAWFEQYK